MNRKSLGKGLDALIPGAGTFGIRTIQEVNVELLKSNPFQPRIHMDEGSLQDLADSIKIYGILQPVIVRRQGDGYEIIAGERRWRAAKIAGLSTLPVIVEDIDEQKRLEVALIENLQREDLNVLDLAKGIRTLMNGFELTQEEVSQRLGKKRPTVANILRLLELPPEIQVLLEEEKISFGHARSLLGLDEREKQIHVAEKIVHDNLTVRDVEKLIREMIDFPQMNIVETKENPLLEKKAVKTMEENAMEEILTSLLATKVRVGKKRITIDYYGDDDLQRIYALIIGHEETF
ncbi:MAG: ParB/RepB/Spo0J family partition protein [Candidatus Atribacteria bacterium]|nr:ParB/RepB/Spo0J family partition protein [Candidatus Atribacteria bacterium]